MAGITFSEARTITIAKYYTEWEDLTIEPFVAEFGYENDNEFLMVVGTRSFIVDGDVSSQMIDDAAYLVDKRTGVLEMIPMYAMDRARYRSFTRFGDFPAWFD